ncbi:hypothetical protein B0F89_11162 [Malaciobacter marinus]|jgi:hypothetical protein|uniref:Lipoprotein n=1 Tax=Malaciobacter marinus TaxID=505249 RepID=A0AB36ZWA3_9BACT|nr:hypothetical protein [Malaciobacter marinus]PPK61292.1 hypothetical protein B0F89_11162 [Malaciobacter marinus]
MKKILISSLFVSSLLFNACTTNHALLNFKKENIRNSNALQFTKKSDIKISNEPKVQFFASYLNKINRDLNNNKEEFLIGVYLINSKTQNFLQEGFLITLNDKEPLDKILVDEKSELIKSLPIKNPWGRYYKVEFEKQEEGSMILKLEKPNFGQTQLNFQK